MILRRNRHVLLLPLLCAVCHLTLAFPAQTPRTHEDIQQLQVKIPTSALIFAPLGSSTTIPCLVSLSPTPSYSFPPVVPRVKWSVVSNGVETEILVVRGQRVKISEAYRERAALLNYTSSPDDLSLWLGDLRSSDSGHYRCEVQQGLEDASDHVQLKIKGVVFHYRDALGRYAFSFHQAQKACEGIGAHIATPDQLLAAYYDGYEQCDAGWLADQSVRYPIQVPREGCYGDMDGQPGVRNYGTLDPDDLFDVYCYVEQIHGEVFHDPTPQHLTFDEAQAYCKAAGAELATTGQLYLAWSEGLDRCSPGWLSDGSVRYPIINPRERCGGPQAGVKTLYRFSNQTGFPEPSSHHDVYCFKVNGNAHTDSPMDYVATEPEDIGQDVVILTETDEELQLNQHSEQVEREAQSALESLPFFSGPSIWEGLVGTSPTAMLDTTESPLNSTASLDILQPFDETSPPAEMDYDSQHPTASLLSANSSTDAYDSQHLTTLLPSINSSTDAYNSHHPTTLLPSINSSTDAYNSQHNMTLLPNVNSSTDAYISQHNTTLLPNVSSSTDAYISQHNTTLLPNVNSSTDAYISQYPTTLLPSTKNETDSHHKGNFSLHQPKLANNPLFPEPSYEPHRHYQPMPDINLEDHESQLSDGSKHYQPMPETNLDFDRLEANYSKTYSNHSQEENATEPTPMTLNPMLQLEQEEAVVEEPAETSHSVGQFVTQPAQSTLSPTREVSSVLFPLDGSGDFSQDSDLDVRTDSSSATSKSSPSPSSPTIALHLSPSATVIPTESPDQSVSSGRQHSEELGLNMYSTVAHLWESSISRQEGSTSLESDEMAITESVSSGEKQQHPTKSEEHLVSGADLTTTESPELSNTSQMPSDSPTASPQTSAYRLHVDATAVALEEGSGHEPATMTPTMDEEVTVLPLDSQTSTWAPLSTTYGPQESLDDLENSRGPSSVSSTVAPDSSTEPDFLSSKPTPATTMTSTQWSTRTWSPPTTSPKVFHETAEPQKVTALIPPVDQGRIDLEFTLTQPPTLLILPNERAAVDGTGKLSDACLKDPCLNGGTCTEHNGGTKCLCLPSYGGDFCETDLEQCEPGWDKFHGFCYRHFSQRLSWEVAEQHCRMLGAHLVSIMTPEEQSYINSNYKEYQWTGLNDKTIEEDFRWSDGNPLLYENWYRGQPDSYFLSGEDCVVMVWHDDGRWSDVPCNYHLAYTCKKGTTSCGPPPKVPHASIFGKVRQRYETDAVVRYYCTQGFEQRLNPLARCLSGGRWEEPQIICIPEAGGTAAVPEVTSLTTGSFDTIEDEFLTTKESPQYWDIKF